MAASKRPTLMPESLVDHRPDKFITAPLATRSGRRRWTVLLVAAGLVLVLIAAAGFVLRQKAIRLQADLTAAVTKGQAQLEAGKTALKAANQQHLPKDISLARADFAAAKRSFAAAAARADSSSLLRLGARLPLASGFVKPRVAAVDRISAMGIDISDAADQIAAVDLRLLQPSGSSSAGAKLLATIRTSTGDLTSIRSKLAAADQAVAGIDPAVLSSSQRQTVTKARSTIKKGLAGIDEFTRLTPALIEILGGNGKRTYLIEQVNSSELRSGGGFIGTESVVSVDNGTFKLVSSGDSYSFDGYVPWTRPRVGTYAYVPPPTALLGFYGGYSWNFEDSNFSADFGTNAQWAQYFAEKRRGLKVDAVMAMDPYMVANILKVTGPITVPGYGVTFDSGNFVDQVFLRDLGSDPNHKSILAAAAGPLVERISSLPADRWPQLIDVMNQAVGQRHLQVQFNNQTAETEMGQLGWSGKLNPSGAQDFFLETEDNFAANKTNHYIKRQYTVTLTRTAGGLHHEVVVDITDQRGTPSWYPHRYIGYVRFYTTKDATALQLTTSTREYRSQIPANPGSSAPSGYSLKDGWIFITLNPGQSGHFQLTFQYDTPWTTDAHGDHVMYWQKQPGTVDDAITVIWNGGGQTFKTSGNLTEDQQITLSSKGLTMKAAQTSAVTLPSLSF